MYGDAEENIYEDMVRKLINIRIEEFLATTRQKIACKKGSASTKEQNLRDSVLTQHTKFQSQVIIK
jgi:hypothetical protein